MKRSLYTTFITGFFFFIGCDDVINPELPKAEAVLVVDAWINNLPGPQVIKLTRSQPYFDSSQPPGVPGAVVSVSTPDKNFPFVETDNGQYVWNPDPGETFGVIGETYTLNISVDGEEYTSTSQMKRVPAIDSVTFRFEEENFILPDSYWGEFWSRDPEGEGDTYWIKSYKNEMLLNKPEEINIAYDAGFSKGGGLDNLIFIPPIRDTINPFEQDENDEFLSPFEDGDSLYVEVHSINEAAFNFLFNVQIQTNRPGGFGELFAQPLANVPTNIENTNATSTQPAQGIFNVAAVSFNGKRLDVSEVPKGN